MYIVSLSYKKPLSEVDSHIEAHVRYLEQHYASGHFIASGRKVPRTGGVILAQAANREALTAILQQDPFFIADVADYDITEFVPSMTAPAFSALKELL